MYPSNTMYSQYGNTYRVYYNFGSSSYGSRTGSFDYKLKSTNYDCGFDYVKKKTQMALVS
jgi:hypothetical protein